MAEPVEDKDPKQIVKEQLWTVTTNAFILAVAFGAGTYTGYLKWGDAVGLRKKVKQANDQIIRLKNERNDLEGRAAVIESRYDSCKEDLTKARAGG